MNNDCRSSGVGFSTHPLRFRASFSHDLRDFVSATISPLLQADGTVERATEKKKKKRGGGGSTGFFFFHSTNGVKRSLNELEIVKVNSAK